MGVRPACYDWAMTWDETDDIHDELVVALDTAEATEAPAPADAYRVERVLKQAPGELTQLVYLRTANGGELGPYVRKVIDRATGLGGTYEALAAREREGLRVRQLPRIIECRHVGTSLVVVMECVPGRTLREVVEAAVPGQRLPLAARLMPAVCDAVEELHTALDQPIVHRDLTPGNVMCPDGDPAVPVLIDLGIARLWHDGAERDTTHFGTRAYAPPEQYGFGQTDVRTDVYELGLLALFCLTGRDPAPADRRRGFSDPAVPEPWRAVIARAASLDPDARFGSAAELAAAFRELAAATSPSSASSKTSGPEKTAPEKTAPEKPVRLWTPRNVVVTLAFAVIVVASLYDAATPAQWIRGGVALNVFSFVILMPYLAFVVAYALLDKRWLRARVGWLAARTPRRALRDLLLALLGLFAAFAVLIVFSGA